MSPAAPARQMAEREAIRRLRIFKIPVSMVKKYNFLDCRRGTKEKTELVTSGIFQISRNPAFLGFDLLYAGILLRFFNVPLCISTLLGGLLFHLQIVNVEEDFLLQEFGEDYVQYKKTVCRYLGKRFSRSAS